LSKWNTGYSYTETDNGLLLEHGGRATTDADQSYAIKFAYGSHDMVPATLTLKEGGVPVDFVVSSIDISQASGTDVGTPKYVQGKLSGVVQWEILPPDNNSVATYTSPTSGNMSLPIDTIEWAAGWIDGGGYPKESTIDNLQVTVVD
jgi:hypothetical protein